MSTYPVERRSFRTRGSFGSLFAPILIALALISAGCSTSGSAPATTVIHGDTVPTVAQLGPTSFTGPGPFAAGVTTLPLEANGPLVEVWYPATPASVKGHTQASYNVASWLPPALRALIPAHFDGAIYRTDAYRGVPVASGRFPLVVFTHGYSGFRDQSTFLTTRLASWGFVVAAADLPDNDLTAVLSGKTSQGITTDIAEQQQVITLMGGNAQDAGMFHGHIDMSRVAAIGHSLGGAVSEGLAAADPRVTTFIGMAGATVGSFGQTTSGPTSTVPDKPGMLMVGTADQIASPTGIAKAFTAMRSPKRLVTLHNFGHLVFADICEIGAGKGGLLAIASEVHITVPPSLKTLASDGCNAPDTPVAEGWPVIRQSVTAQLRHVFGFDSSLAGLTGLKAAFPETVSRNVYIGGSTSSA
ncbi:MAG: dienelactone hydrolase family protein [Acidimicrobiales bacterium]|jgi:predicted dienelactone hydrolase